MVDFEELVTVRGTALLRFALMLCGDPDQAQNLVQSVLVKAYRQWARVAGADHPEAYLKAMIVNEQLSWWRRRASREVPIPTHHDPVITDSADAYAERDAAWAMLGRLGKRQRAVLVLRYYEDLSDERIAAVLGCTASTVRSNASRALATLRATLPSLDTEALP
jgi:RNA polymerase sigma-70 factor (sigma-E family)